MDQEAKIVKAEELAHSRLLDAGKVSNHTEAKSLVSSIYDMMGAQGLVPRKKKDQKKLRDHIRSIVLDLYDAWVTDPTLYLGYSRDRNDYGPDSRNKALFFTYRHTLNVIDFLIKNEFVENHMGRYDRTKQRRSFRSRMRATDKLVDLLSVQHPVPPESVEKDPYTECIILRNVVEVKDKKNKAGRKKFDIPYTNTLETKQMRYDLLAYNNLLRRTFIDVAHFPKEGIPSKNGKRMIRFNRNNKFVRRVFNNGTWDDGGRFYGGFWQTLPKEWRLKIRIDGRMVAEIDYSGLHIVLLYALTGIDYWEEIGKDPYQIEGYEQSERMRSFLKQVLLTAINSKNLGDAVKSVNWEMTTDPECDFLWVREEGLKARDVVEAFARQHSPIAHHFFSGYGVRLQNIDSMIAEYVINKMTEQEIPVLCVHDSFITTSFNSEKLNELMQEAFSQVIDAFFEGDREMIARVKLKGLSRQSQTYWSGAGMRGPYGDRDMALSALGLTNPDYELQNRQIEFEKAERERIYYTDDGRELRGIYKEQE